MKVKEISWIDGEIISIVHYNTSSMYLHFEIEKLTELNNRGIIDYTMDYNNDYVRNSPYDLILNIYY